MSREDAPMRKFKFVRGKFDDLFYFFPTLLWSYGEGIALGWLRWGVGIGWQIDIRRN